MACLQELEAGNKKFGDFFKKRNAALLEKRGSCALLADPFLPLKQAHSWHPRAVD
jgi:hypothetical protein